MASGPTNEEERMSLSDACRAMADRDGIKRDADIVQDAYVRALSRSRNVAQPMRYLLRIARNAFIDGKRRAAREAALFSPASQELPGGDRIDPERILGAKQELRRVLAAIEALPPRCREAFVLHRFDELSYPAIARQMGVSISMVEKHVAEAMLRLSRATRDD